MIRKFLLKSEIIETFIKCSKLLSRRDRGFLFVFLLLNVFLAFLEVFAVVLIGATVAKATAVIQSKELSGIVSRVEDLFTWTEFTPQAVVGILGILVAMLLIGKSILSFYLSKRNFAFLSRREPLICETFSSKVFSRSLDEVNQFSSSDYQHALTLGSNAVLSGVIGGTVLLSGEVLLQLGLSAALFVYSPILMISCSIILALIFFILYRSQGLKAQKIGIEKTNISTKILSIISSLTESYRDVYVMGKRYEYIKKLRVLKEDIATFDVRGQLLGFSAKYVFDVAIVVLALFIGAYSFLVGDATNGLATIAVFLAGISRLAPSVMRLQQGLVNIRGAIGSTRNFFRILEYKSNSLKELSRDNSLKSLHNGNVAQEKNRIAIEANCVSFRYISKDRPAINKVSFQVPAGETWAIVGRSGSGKSTLVDLLLGLNDPDSGHIRILDQDPRTAINCGAVQIGYVPQKVFITSGTVTDNVSFEPSSQTDLRRVQECIKLVGLENWVQELPNEYETHLGEGESQLSGGQRQRLGIARALYRRPELLILDEATSSLDAESERVISEALQSMYGEITILIVAHRLSSIRNADKIIYMRHGRVIEVGSFSTLKKKIPEFKRQASLMGL